MQTLLLVDGNALMHRAYHALPPFKTKSGIPTNAVYGFFAMLHKAIMDFNPQYIAVCFDTPKPTFRKKLLKTYQIQRPKMDDELGIQFPMMMELLKKAGIFTEEMPGFEADDVIGSITHEVHGKNVKVMILTGDKDIMQLINDHVYTVNPQIGFSKTKIYDKKEVREKFGIEPEQIADFKALMGDASDNYPGAKGIGPKTAANLVRQFGSVENLIKNIDQIENPKVREIIKKEEKNILLSKKLATIITDAKIKFRLNDARFDGFKQDLKEALLQLEMYSLTNRFFKSEKKTEPKKRKTEDDSNQIGLF